MGLGNTILPEAHKVPEYTALHNRLKTEFLDQGISNREATDGAKLTG